MRVSHIHIGLVISALLGTDSQHRLEAAVSATSEPPQSKTPATQALEWRKATREDVVAAYHIFSHHHPGMFDPHNPGFPDQLRRARDAALQFAEGICDAEGHMRVLALFSAALGDGHARVQAAYSGHGSTLWPGFRTVWRGSGLHVVDPDDEDAPPKGSVLLACDGRNSRDVIREAMWFHGRPNEEGQWWTNAPFFFQRARSPYEKLPRQCSFRRPDGRTATYSLNWRPMPRAAFEDWFKAASRREPIGLTEPRTGIHLLTLTTFSPDDQGRAHYNRLFRDIDRNIATITAARAVVIDLRNNGGGSSSWGEDVASKLWGEAAVEAKLSGYFRTTQVWWFADAANIEHFRQLATKLRTQGRGKDAAQLDGVVRHLRTALNEGARFYVDDYGASLATGNSDAEPRQLPPVYVITDGGCASACLDALDVFTQFPGVKLVGAPTSADSNYLDIRFEPLPSQRGVVILPTKIWVNRPRRSGQVYRPDIPVNDLDWTTSTMLDHIEKDLTR